MLPSSTCYHRLSHSSDLKVYQEPYLKVLVHMREANEITKRCKVCILEHSMLRHHKAFLKCLLEFGTGKHCIFYHHRSFPFGIKNYENTPISKIKVQSPENLQKRVNKSEILEK